MNMANIYQYQNNVYGVTKWCGKNNVYGSTDIEIYFKVQPERHALLDTYRSFSPDLNFN